VTRWRARLVSQSRGPVSVEGDASAEGILGADCVLILTCGCLDSDLAADSITNDR